MSKWGPADEKAHKSQEIHPIRAKITKIPREIENSKKNHEALPKKKIKMKETSKTAKSKANEVQVQKIPQHKER